MKLRTLLIVWVFASTALNARAQGVDDSIARLESALSSSASPIDKLGNPDSLLADCSQLDDRAIAELHEDARGTRIKYLYDHMYVWTEVGLNGQRCVILDYPEKRALSRHQALVLLTAVRLNLIRPQNDVGCEVGPCNPLTGSELVPEYAPSPKSLAAITDNRMQLSNSGYPYGALAFVQFPVGTGYVNGSATQVSPNVYVTAAHVVLDSTTGSLRTGGHIFPGYNNAGANTNLAITNVVVFPGYLPYVRDPNNRKALPNDIAFIEVAKASTPRYGLPTFYFVNSALDVNAPFFGNLGKPLLDPWYSCGAVYRNYCSWFLGFQAGIMGASSEIQSIGYPDYVNNSRNINTYNHGPNPYLSGGGYLVGGDDGSGANAGQYYELLHDADVTVPPSIGVAAAMVSSGDSGGPLIAKITPSTGGFYDSVVIGIAVAIGPGGGGITGTGYFDYNKSWFEANVAWVPGVAINVTQPLDGASYDAATVPTFVADAGAYTPSLQWVSDVDGILGNGGSVNVAKRLTPGMHNISVTTAGSAPKGVMTFSIVITAQASNLTGTPNPVLVQASRTFDYTTLAWTSPSYASLDVTMTVSGVTSLLASGGTTGSANVPIYRGSSYQFALYNKGNRSVPLATASVSGVPAPTLAASPNPVQIYPPQTQGTTTVSWNATGVGISYVALFVSCNGAPQSIVTGSAAVVGTQGVTWITPGSLCIFNLYPSDNRSRADLSKLLASIDVVGEANAPAPIIYGSSSPVVVPYGYTSTIWTLAWNAPNFSQIDVWGEQNLQAPGIWNLLGSGPATGAASEPMSVGEIAKLEMYVHGDHTIPLATMTIKGIAGALLSGSSNPVIVPAGQTSTTWTLTWDAPGASAVDLYGQQNLQSPGQTQFLGSGPGSGTASEPMTVGETATLWLYAHGDSATPLATLQISGTH